MARAMIVLRNTCFPPRELGLADRERIAPNTTPPASAGTAPQERRGTKRKRRPVFVLGAASEQQTPRVFLVLLLFGYFLWRRLRMAASCAARDAGSTSTVATSCLSFARRRASSAAFRASVALASSRSRPRIAVSASTVTTSGCTSRMPPATKTRSEEHTSELQSPYDLVCRLLLEK